MTGGCPPNEGYMLFPYIYQNLVSANPDLVILIKREIVSPAIGCFHSIIERFVYTNIFHPPRVINKSFRLQDSNCGCIVRATNDTKYVSRGRATANYRWMALLVTA